MRVRLANLSRDESGVAVVEFAFWSALFFVVALVALDFGGFYIQRGQVSEAVSAVAVASFQDRENVKFSEIPLHVQNLAENPHLSVSTSCNGEPANCTNLSRNCACLNSDAGYSARTCGDPCGGGGTAGFYLTIEANHHYTPMLVPKGVLANAPIVHTATVRLE